MAEAAAKKKPSRYDNPPKPMQKRSSSDPTMSQMKNSAASKTAGEGAKAEKKVGVDITDPKGPTPDLDSGTEAVPTNARHASERSEMATRHDAQVRSLHTEYERKIRETRDAHEADIASMRQRHEGEVAREGATRTTRSSTQPRPRTSATSWLRWSRPSFCRTIRPA